uniref:Membrane metallo-endopeptidase-like 1 n=1 Tax=Scolopendra viridis TaxID=118503 RepID=A0A4D5R9R2_SCOVI
MAEYSPDGRKSRTIPYCNPWLTICLGVLALILLIASITLLVLLLLPKDTSKEKEENNSLTSSNICLTKDCVRTAYTLLESMDTSVDVCEDFYEFTCGNFIKKHPVPDQKVSVSVFEQYQDIYERQLRDIIESDFTDGRSLALARAQEAYHVCLNTSFQSNKELKSFKKFLNDTLGGWPLAVGDRWKPTNSLEEFIGKLYRLGFDLPFGTFAVEIDVFNPGTNIIAFRAPSSDSFITLKNKLLKIRKKSIANEAIKISNAYVHLFEETAKVLGVKDLNEKEILRTTRSILLLMAKMQIINDITSEDEEEEVSEEGDEDEEEYGESGEEEYEEDFEDIDYEYYDDVNETAVTMTLKEMNEHANGKVNWLTVLNIMFDGIHTFTEDDWISADEAYVEALSNFLTSQSRRDLANYFIWEIILQSLDHSSTELGKILQDFQAVLSETYRRPFRWNVCTQWIQSAYPFAMTRFFVDKYIDPQSKETVDEMIQLVQKAYKRMIQKSVWVDKETKRNALKKANNMKRFISYPNFIFDDKLLEDFYKYLPTVKSVHFENFLDTKANYTTTLLLEYETPTVYKWDFNPLEINAFYAAWSNSIWFPTGILQLPFFDVSRPAAVNYAMIGSIIGHEVGHGFDDSGKDYDDGGRLKEWWTQNTLEKYENRTKCFVKQYDNFCPEELYTGSDDDRICVNGEQTLGENIADNTGLKAAFTAYKMWIHKHGQENRLPGLEEYTPIQIFFISYAYTWCENIPIENWENVYADDEHSPAKYRVLGTLPNMREFANAFKCPVGKMNNGAKRCSLW